MSWWLLAALTGLLLFVGLAAWARPRLLRWLRRRRAPYRTRHPIVLVHGLMGFDEIRVGETRHEYFRGVERRLRAWGNEVHRPRLPAVASVARRARALADYVDGLDTDRVILVAHSMGGLDARYAITRLGLRERVEALITIGTPHRGTPLADVGTSLAGRVGLKALAKAVGLDLDAFDDLTSARMEAFNRDVRDDSGVLYLSVVGRGGAVHPLLRATHAYLSRVAGANDGLVPTGSQAWGEVVLELDVDHWGQVGWSEGGDGTLYDRIAGELVARGY